MNQLDITAYNPEPEASQDEILQAQQRLSRDIVALIAGILEEETSAVETILSDPVLLRKYLKGLNEAIDTGLIIEPENPKDTPCGESLSEVMEDMQAKLQRLEDPLSRYNGYFAIPEEIRTLLATWSEKRLDAFLRPNASWSKLIPMGFVKNLAELPDDRFYKVVDVMKVSYEKSGRELPPLSASALVELGALSDDLFEALLNTADIETMIDIVVFEEVEKGNSPYTDGTSIDPRGRWHASAKVEDIIRLIAKLKISPAIIAMVHTFRRILSIRPDGLEGLMQTMSPERWNLLVENTKTEGRTLSMGLVGEVAKLTDEQWAELKVKEICRYGNRYEKILETINRGNFLPERIRAISAQEDLTEVGIPLLETMGSLTDEQIESLGGIKHILDCALGASLTEKEGEVMSDELVLLRKRYPLQEDVIYNQYGHGRCVISQLMNDLVNGRAIDIFDQKIDSNLCGDSKRPGGYRPDITIALLHEALRYTLSQGLRPGASVPLTSALEIARFTGYREDSRVYGLLAKADEGYRKFDPSRNFRKLRDMFDAFQECRKGVERTIRHMLETARLTYLEPQDRSALDPDSEIFLHRINHGLVRTPILRRFKDELTPNDSRDPSTRVSPEMWSAAEWWPRKLDNGLSHFERLEEIVLIHQYFPEAIIAICNGDIRKILVKKDEAFFKWLSNQGQNDFPERINDDQVNILYARFTKEAGTEQGIAERKKVKGIFT
ncbi:hypothetical protein HYV57_04190 [Candidatus Peregrinibacteria bacterium]|nr:hypothetical protein [Candidatus Peregrinibacteria bacterium]